MVPDENRCPLPLDIAILLAFQLKSTRSLRTLAKFCFTCHDLYGTLIPHLWLTVVISADVPLVLFRKRPASALCPSQSRNKKIQKLDQGPDGTNTVPKGDAREDHEDNGLLVSKLQQAGEIES